MTRFFRPKFWIPSTKQGPDASFASLTSSLHIHVHTCSQAAASCNDRWVWLNQQQQAWPCHAVQQAPGMCDTPSSIRVAPAARWVAGRSSELFWFDLHLLGSHRIAWGAVCRPCRRPGCCCLLFSSRPCDRAVQSLTHL